MIATLARIAAALLLTVSSCAPTAAPAPGPPLPSRYIFYLHGAIVENLGPRGRSEQFGEYDLPGILEALKDDEAAVIGEQRPKGTDPSAYADKLAGRIRRLVESGVRPERITVIGASKGAVIAALLSSRIKIGGLNYVLLGNCNDWLIRTFDPRLTGRVLSI